MHDSIPPEIGIPIALILWAVVTFAFLFSWVKNSRVEKLQKQIELEKATKDKEFFDDLKARYSEPVHIDVRM
jgi:hypothetical protein